MNLCDRLGVNNVAVVEKVVFRTDCRGGNITWLPLHGNTTEAARRPRLFWLLPHARLTNASESRPDETREVIGRYARDSIPWIREDCGEGVGIIDAFNFTKALAETLPEEARSMTWDRKHWGRAVNLIKAQLILRALVAE